MTNTIHDVVIKCRLLSGEAYGTRMGLTVTANASTVFQAQSLTSDILDIEFTSKLPLTLQFRVDGKMPEDTEVDDQGNVIKDKCVILDALCINGIWIKKWMLENKTIVFVPDSGQQRINNYFGQNGTANFTIPYTDMLEFWLDLMTVDQ